MSEENRFDVLIIGAGVAGLSAAIKLKQKAMESGYNLSVCVVEKSLNIGNHILSGAVLETEALTELFPDWERRNSPIRNKVKKHKKILLTDNAVLPIILPDEYNNNNCFIISLGELCEWLAEEAKKLGVNFIYGSSVVDFTYDEENAVNGIIIGEGDIIASKQVIIAEGAFGYMAQKAIKKYGLIKGLSTQTYSLCFKEVWQIESDSFVNGLSVDIFARTKDKSNFIRGFVNHFDDEFISISVSIPLDYKNPYIDPFKEFQNFKTNDHIKSLFDNANRRSYGAKIVPDGGYNSLPKMSFAGGVIIGDSAGLMNFPKFKGISNAMFSGITAGDVIFNHIKNETINKESEFNEVFCKTKAVKDLYKVRNIRAGFRFGVFFGLLNFIFDSYLLKGRFDIFSNYKNDFEHLKKASKKLKINYEADDGIVTFDKVSSNYLTDVDYRKRSDCHLFLKDLDAFFDNGLKKFDSPELKYCPSGVFDSANKKLDFINCINCKTCEIKDPFQAIKWTPPQNGDGTNYKSM